MSYKHDVGVYVCFGGQQSQWAHFQFCISGGHLGIQDGRHGTFVFIYLVNKAHPKVHTVSCNLMKIYSK